MRNIFLVFIIVILSSCTTNLYEEYYNDNNLDTAVLSKLKTIKYPKIIYVSDVDKAVKEYQSEGYLVMGESSFTGDWQSKIYAIDFAEEVKADIVLIQLEYLRTANRNYSKTYAQPHTTYNNGSVSAYGSGGYATGSYSETSTYYTYHSYSVNYNKMQFKERAVFIAHVAGE